MPDIQRTVSAASRIAGRKAGQNRLLRAAIAAGKTTLKSVFRVLHLLWLEVTGFLFISFAVIGSFAALREYREYVAGKMGPGRALTALCFTVVFGWFGVSSFWRARRR